MPTCSTPPISTPTTPSCGGRCAAGRTWRSRRWRSTGRSRSRADGCTPLGEFSPKDTSPAAVILGLAAAFKLRSFLVPGQFPARAARDAAAQGAQSRRLARAVLPATHAQERGPRSPCSPTHCAWRRPACAAASTCCAPAGPTVAASSSGAASCSPPSGSARRWTRPCSTRPACPPTRSSPAASKAATARARPRPAARQRGHRARHLPAPRDELLLWRPHAHGGARPRQRAAAQAVRHGPVRQALGDAPDARRRRRPRAAEGSHRALQG